MNDEVLKRLYQVVLDRKANPQEGSYTCYLFDKGVDKILKKVGEECAETIIAAKNGVEEDTVNECSDLLRSEEHTSELSHSAKSRMPSSA